MTHVTQQGRIPLSIDPVLTEVACTHTAEL